MILPRLFTAAAIAVGVLLQSFGQADAHALDPGFLEIREVGGASFSVAFKIPQVAGQPMRIQAVLPENCAPRTIADSIWVESSFATNWVAKCEGGLSGGTVEVKGLGATDTDVLVRFEHFSGESEIARLNADKTSHVFSGPTEFWDVVRTYFLLGVEHIVFGFDHLLFVLTLMLLVSGTMRLVKTITAFTIAHSITLSAAALGFVAVPGPPVEAVIALSIVFVATEVVRRSSDAPRFSERRPWVIAFTFGLLHGFGFAGALEETGLPNAEIPAALLTFNLGVEAGQLLFIAAALAAWALWSRASPLVPSVLRHHGGIRLASIYFIGAIASFWLIDRLANLFA